MDRLEANPDLERSALIAHPTGHARGITGTGRQNTLRGPGRQPIATLDRQPTLQALRGGNLKLSQVTLLLGVKTIQRAERPLAVAPFGLGWLPAGSP